MGYSNRELWHRFQKYYTEFPQLGLSLDLSRVNFPDDYLPSMAPRFQKAFADMAALEKGGIANPDENRMVGHYWLRNPALAPTSEIREAIEGALGKIKEFSAKVHSGAISGSRGPFRRLLLIGIGGSALGPQFVSRALGDPGKDKLTPYFFDNTDPDGFDNVLSSIGPKLGETLSIVVSKSGGTIETRNGMLEAEAAFRRERIHFPAHAIAITSENSSLDQYAQKNKWLARFPMWDWVGGRTSELSPVGLVPAALMGFDIDAMLTGAKLCDECTRVANIETNPAARLAAMWFHIGNGKGDKSMVILPYKDRLELFSRYLQQLVMESLGKAQDLDGHLVHQGITVFGNKGSTDQHAYVQQLRDGLDNFFVTFIRVLKDRTQPSMEVETGVTSGDYLDGFLQGTRRALYESDRQSILIGVKDTSAFTIGVIIALFERTVGHYASLVNINAYHQPGVEAGKKAASAVIALQRKTLTFLKANRNKAHTVNEVAAAIAARDDVETVFHICEHLAANGRGISRVHGTTPFAASYQALD